MQITQLAKDALELTWRRKYLWVFGIFVAAGGGGGGGGAPGKSKDGVAQAMPSWFWYAVAAAIVFALVSLVLHVLGEAALISSVREERNGARSTVRAGFREGRRHFWTVLGLKVLAGAVVLVTAAVVAAPALLAALKLVPIAVGIAVTLLAIVPAIPWVLSVYFAYQYALRFAVLDGVGVDTAVRRAWAHLHGRLADSLKLLGLALVGQMGAGMLTFAAMVPGVLVGGAVYLASSESIPALIAGGAVALPFVIMVMGAQGAFQSSLWTLGFLETRRETA